MRALLLLVSSLLCLGQAGRHGFTDSVEERVEGVGVEVKEEPHMFHLRTRPVAPPPPATPWQPMSLGEYEASRRASNVVWPDQEVQESVPLAVVTRHGSPPPRPPRPAFAPPADPLVVAESEIHENIIRQPRPVKGAPPPRPPRPAPARTEDSLIAEESKIHENIIRQPRPVKGLAPPRPPRPARPPPSRQVVAPADDVKLPIKLRGQKPPPPPLPKPSNNSLQESQSTIQENILKKLNKLIETNGVGEAASQEDSVGAASEPVERSSSAASQETKESEQILASQSSMRKSVFHQPPAPPGPPADFSRKRPRLLTVQADHPVDETRPKVRRKGGASSPAFPPPRPPRPPTPAVTTAAPLLTTTQQPQLQVESRNNELGPFSLRQSHKRRRGSPRPAGPPPPRPGPPVTFFGALLGGGAAAGSEPLKAPAGPTSFFDSLLGGGTERPVRTTRRTTAPTEPTARPTKHRGEKIFKPYKKTKKTKKLKKTKVKKQNDRQTTKTTVAPKNGKTEKSEQQKPAIQFTEGVSTSGRQKIKQSEIQPSRKSTQKQFNKGSQAESNFNRQTFHKLHQSPVAPFQKELQSPPPPPPARNPGRNQQHKQQNFNSIQEIIGRGQSAAGSPPATTLSQPEISDTTDQFLLDINNQHFSVNPTILYDPPVGRPARTPTRNAIPTPTRPSWSPVSARTPTPARPIWSTTPQPATPAPSSPPPRLQINQDPGPAKSAAKRQTIAGTGGRQEELERQFFTGSGPQIPIVEQTGVMNQDAAQTFQFNFVTGNGISRTEEGGLGVQRGQWEYTAPNGEVGLGGRARRAAQHHSHHRTRTASLGLQNVRLSLFRDARIRGPRQFSLGLGPRDLRLGFLRELRLGGPRDLSIGLGRDVSIGLLQDLRIRGPQQLKIGSHRGTRHGHH